MSGVIGMVEEQIRELAEVLDRSGLTWWVDSGTLLGLVREGRILDSDYDLDMGCWAQAEGWDNLENLLRQAGYRIGRKSYAGVIYKYWLDGRTRPVDLRIWRVNGDTAICPTSTNTESPFPKHSLRWWLWGMTRRPAIALLRPATMHGISRPRDRTLAALGRSAACWQVPSHYYQTPTSIAWQGLSLPAPAPIDGYLSWRYGDWRTPVDDWKFKRDDPAFTWDPPVALPRTPPFMRSLL